MVAGQHEGLGPETHPYRAAHPVRIHHGILTAGPTVEAAAWWYIALDNVCQTQLLAEAAGTPEPIPHEQAALTHSQIGRANGAAHSFDALWQGLVAAEPELLE